MARRGFFRRIADAGKALFGAAPESTPKPPAATPPSDRPEPPLFPGYGPPVLLDPFHGAPRLDPQGFVVDPIRTPFEKVLHAEGFVDFEWYDRTGETVVTDDEAARLIYEGWFDPDSTPDSRMQARQDYFDYTGTEPNEFDWYDWREWYEATAA